MRRSCLASIAIAQGSFVGRGCRNCSRREDWREVHGKRQSGREVEGYRD